MNTDLEEYQRILCNLRQVEPVQMQKLDPQITVSRDLVNGFIKGVKSLNTVSPRGLFLVSYHQLMRKFKEFYSTEFGIKKQLYYDKVYQSYTKVLKQRLKVMKFTYEDESSEFYVTEILA